MPFGIGKCFEQFLNLKMQSWRSNGFRQNSQTASTLVCCACNMSLNRRENFPMCRAGRFSKRLATVRDRTGRVSRPDEKHWSRRGSPDGQDCLRSWSDGLRDFRREGPWQIHRGVIAVAKKSGFAGNEFFGLFDVRNNFLNRLARARRAELASAREAPIGFRKSRRLKLEKSDAPSEEIQCARNRGRFYPPGEPESWSRLRQIFF